MNILVYHTLPLVKSYTELEREIPGIINYTLLIIQVRDIPIRTVLGCKLHRIEVYEPAGILTI